MVLIGSLYASDSVHKDHGFARWVVVVTIYVFAAAYCMTWALGVKIFASEIQPVATRANATSLAQSANCVSLQYLTSNYVQLICYASELYTKNLVTDHELSRRSHDTHLSRQVLLGRLLSLRRVLSAHRRCMRAFHARDARPIARGY